MMRYLSILLIVVVTIMGCSDQGARPGVPKAADTDALPPPSGSPLTLSILPVESAGSMYERFLPLKYQLEFTLKRPVTIVIAKDYETAIHDIGTGQVHLACLDPAAYCEVRARYRDSVIPLVRIVEGWGALSKSVLVTKAGKGIHNVADVRGKRIALGSRQSSFSHLIPLAMLNDVGIGINHLGSVDYLQEEDRVALSVLVGNHDVGAMSESVARKYSRDGLEIIKTSDSISPFVICASDRLSRETRDRIRTGLLSAPEGGSQRFIEGGNDRFVNADDRDFDVVRVMIKNLTGKDSIEYRPETIKVAILPLYSTITLYNRYEPLMRYLSRKTGREFKLVVPRDFDDFVDVVKSGKADFSYQNPYVYSLIDRTLALRPLVTTIGEDSPAGGQDSGDSYRGVIITRIDSPIDTIALLKNKRVLITSPKSAGGYLSQRIYLLRQGIDPDRDIKIIDAKRQENVILGVYRGEADAGFVRESALVVWKDAVDMKKLRILARTEPLPNWPFALCRSVDPALVKTVTRLLIELRDRDVLGSAKIRGFKKADKTLFETMKPY
jgi:phosphate/phosphite/phosphonate ABC transporter binding protein